MNMNFPKIENDIIKNWEKDNVFEKSLKSKKEFVIYDGPPFANGLPHYGHLLTGFIKDLFARFHTMLNSTVERDFGWDCHGLPAEIHAEKSLGVSGKLQIEKYGVEKFNDFCKNSVLKYSKEWEFYVTRQARWVNFKNTYKTMDLNYMESVIWAFSELYKKGLIYESTRVMPYSWACETPVSDFETRIDNSYRQKNSKAVTVLFKLCKNHNILKQHKDIDIKLSVWTTTPWTLPSNLAIAVRNDIDYAIILREHDAVIIARTLLKNYKKELGEKIIGTIKGKDLIGVNYTPIFSYFKNHKNAFKILHGDFVTTETGTGIVHIAPGFGEDDYRICIDNDIKHVCPIDDSGKFTEEIKDFAKEHVFDTNDKIISYLKSNNMWLKTEQYLHNYPHCWRTDTPLIYKAVSSWYVKVTSIKNNIIKNNQKINWIPSHIKNGLFGKWLENAKDWSISRNRFWGCPIPVWKSDDPKYPCVKVYASIKEIEQDFGVKITDLHKPFIDTLVKPNPNDPTGRSKLRRVPEILDCWFESGSMPYAQFHYPFENKEKFHKKFPANFIVEYLAQTRGWFYTMIVLSTALFDKPPFLNCICHGVILGSDKQKLSKRLKNYPDPKEIFEKYGADAMRFYMLSSPVMKGEELIIDDKKIQNIVKLVLIPLWNAFNFFSIYSKADNIDPKLDFSSDQIMDSYIISKLSQTITSTTDALKNYDTIEASKKIEAFLEILNNWYIRRSRERFWRHEKDIDKIKAYNTLYYVLHNFLRLCAPFLPLVTEFIFCSIDKTATSIHLLEYPIPTKCNDELIHDMDKVRDACNTALRIRNEQNIRVRQPLERATFIGVSNHKLSDYLTNLILEEINVKSWYSLGKDKIQEYANFDLKINFSVLAKRAPDKIKSIIKDIKNEKWEILGDSVKIKDFILLKEEFELNLVPKKEFENFVAPLSSNDGLVLLDLNITDNLLKEGIARDIIRLIQQSRKEMELNITERIELSLVSDSILINQAIEKFSDLIKEQTLATSLLKQYIAKHSYKKEFDIKDAGKFVLQIFEKEMK